MVTASRAAAAVVMATAIALSTSCTRVIDDGRAVAATDLGKSAGDGSDCQSVDAPLTTVPARGDREPVLKIPQPEGWQRVTIMDSELLRFTMRNTSLADNGFAPTAVVTLESKPGNADPLEVFSSQNTALESGFGATGLRVTEGTLCGLPAETLDYTAPGMGALAPHPATVVCAVLHTEDATFAATVTVQSADAGNPTYQQDSQTILTGFQMLPPGDG